MRLIDGDALIKILEPHSMRNGAALGWHSGLIDAVIDEIRKMPTIGGWISVKDRLPERKWIDYLVATRIQNDGTRGFNIAWLNDDNGVWKSNDEWICDGREIVTHWMPLPEPPEEEK